MRRLAADELRRRWPSARIVHEFSNRYSSNRLDLAAITQDQLIGVEIKSSRDTLDRLEAQLDAFAPICSRLVVALAPCWNVTLPDLRSNRRLPNGAAYVSVDPQRTPAQATIDRAKAWGSLSTWTVDSEAATVSETDAVWRDFTPHPWSLLAILHVVELQGIADRHRIARTKRTNHRDLTNACFNAMTGHQVITAVCRALRARNAFAANSDPPIQELDASDSTVSASL